MHSVSTRNADDLVGTLGVGFGISTSEVSETCAGLDGEITQVCEHTHTHTHELSVRLPRRRLLQGSGRHARGVPRAGGRPWGVDQRHPRGPSPRAGGPDLYGCQRCVVGLAARNVS